MNEPMVATGSIYWIGVNERETDLFEALRPLPHSVFYDSSLLRGRKTVLVDTATCTFRMNSARKIAVPA